MYPASILASRGQAPISLMLPELVFWANTGIVIRTSSMANAIDLVSIDFFKIFPPLNVFTHSIPYHGRLRYGFLEDVKYLSKKVKIHIFLVILVYIFYSKGSMNTVNTNKLNFLMHIAPKDAVILSSYLVEKGISHDLQKSYERNGWLTRIGRGAYVFSNATPSLEGALFTTWNQAKIALHIGGLSALRMHGYSHFIQLDSTSIIEQIFKRPRDSKPTWFTQEILKKRFDIHSSAFLDSITGIGSFPHRDYAIPVSEPERAILEYLYLCPKEGSLSIAYHMMDMLVALRPDLVQILLNECNSIKVKRLFLYLAETQNHAWFDILNKTTIDLGSGKRVITPGGKLDTKYQIVIEEFGGAE